MIPWNPDEQEIWTIDEAEAKLAGFKFVGCGIYEIGTKTILMYVASEDHDLFIPRGDPKTKYCFLIWNQPRQYTILDFWRLKGFPIHSNVDREIRKERNDN
jgi:hypothetical protein